MRLTKCLFHDSALKIHNSVIYMYFPNKLKSNIIGLRLYKVKKLYYNNIKILCQQKVAFPIPDSLKELAVGF